MEKEALKDKRILKILCKDMYQFISKIVMAYSEK